jgi:hypothetical protein
MKKCILTTEKKVLVRLYTPNEKSAKTGAGKSD